MSRIRVRALVQRANVRQLSVPQGHAGWWGCREREVGTNVVRVTQIDPSQVSVERVGDGSFYMIRDSGYDTRR